MCMQRRSTLHNSQLTIQVKWIWVLPLTSKRTKINNTYPILALKHTSDNNLCVQLKEKWSAQSSPLHSCGGCGYTPTSHALRYIKSVLKLMTVLTQNHCHFTALQQTPWGYYTCFFFSHTKLLYSKTSMKKRRIPLETCSKIKTKSHCDLSTDTHSLYTCLLDYYRNAGRTTFFDLVLSTWAKFLQVTFQQVRNKAQLATKFKTQFTKGAFHFSLRRKRVHLYLCAVRAPTKPHTSLSILENLPSPRLPSPRKALLPLTTLQVWQDSVTLFPFSRSTKFPGRFLPLSLSLSLSLSPSLLFSELIYTSFFLCGCSSGLSRVVG